MPIEKKEQNNSIGLTEKYIEIFGEYPVSPIITCKGANDPNYIAMVKSAIERKKPITEADLEKFFPENIKGNPELTDI